MVTKYLVIVPVQLPLIQDNCQVKTCINLDEESDQYCGR